MRVLPAAQFFGYVIVAHLMAKKPRIREMETATEKRLRLITELAARHTKANTVSREAARKALIREGFYNADGSLSPNYGGPPRKPRRKAQAAE